MQLTEENDTNFESSVDAANKAGAEAAKIIQAVVDKGSQDPDFIFDANVYQSLKTSLEEYGKALNKVLEKMTPEVKDVSSSQEKGDESSQEEKEGESSQEEKGDE